MKDGDLCPLCLRPMMAGPSVTKHHLVPKSRGGHATEHLHRICHNKIHSLLSNKQLETTYNTAEMLREHPGIQTFIAWLAPKDPEFYDRNERAKTKPRGRSG